MEKQDSLEKRLYKMMLESKSDEDIRANVESIGKSFQEIAKTVVDSEPYIQDAPQEEAQ